MDASGTTYEVRMTDKGFVSLDTAMEGKVAILRLQLESNPSDEFQKRLMDVLNENRDLKMIDITTPLSSFDLLRDVFKSTHSYSSGNADYYIQLGTPRKDYKGHKVVMRVRYKGPSATTISTDVEMTGAITNNDQLKDIFRRHGSTIHSLAANTSLDSDFMDLYVDSCKSQSQDCQLESLIVDPSSLVKAPISRYLWI